MGILAVQSGPERGASPLTFTMALVPVTDFEANILAGVPLSACVTESGMSPKTRKVSEINETNFFRNMRAAFQSQDCFSITRSG